MTQRVGLIGFPVDHSLSPVFQQAAFDALALDVRYELWPTPPDDVHSRVEGMRSRDILGANVTVPHKQRVFELVDEVSELARRAGAVNTIVKRDSKLRGENTDVAGFLAPLRRLNLPLATMRAAVLGAGGAARAVVVALLNAHCRHIVIANRTVSRAQALADALDESLEVCQVEDLPRCLGEAGMLVNATSIGWRSEQLPLDEAALKSLSPGSLVYDLTYRETALLRAAALLGHPVLDGLEMLVAQGAESFRFWTGQEPPIAVMLEAARSAQCSR